MRDRFISAGEKCLVLIDLGKLGIDTSESLKKEVEEAFQMLIKTVILEYSNIDEEKFMEFLISPKALQKIMDSPTNQYKTTQATGISDTNEQSKNTSQNRTIKVSAKLTRTKNLTKSMIMVMEKNISIDRKQVRGFDGIGLKEVPKKTDGKNSK